MTETAFQRKLRERREAEALATATGHPSAAGTAPTPSTEYDDLVPDASSTFERTEQDLTIDSLIAGLDIIDAYDKYIPKSRPPQRSGKREGIMIRCPRPDHTDKNPSAWINVDNQTWFCGGCNEGGDKLDLASFYFGIGDYRNGKRFGELRSKIAESLGYTIVTLPGREPTLLHTAPLEPSSVVQPTAPEPTVEAEPSITTVVSFPGTEEEEELKLPTLDWRPLVTPDTFLDSYMQQCTVDDVPEEYHFWNGLVAISMAIGRDVVLRDFQPVLGNLFLCIIGRTGSGKSRSSNHAIRLVEKALPYDAADPMDRGAKKITVPGSAESLINQFSRPIYDPVNPKLIIGHANVRGIVEFAELSSLLARTGRTGSALKPTLMEFFDGSAVISSSSLTSGTQMAKEPFASVITSVQPKALPTLVGHTDADSGFLNRWVFASGTPKKRSAIGGTRVDLDPCVQPLRDIWEWAQDAGEMDWDLEGERAFTTLFDTRIEKIVSTDDTGLFSRLDLLAKKLCLLLAANEKLSRVTAAVVEKVEKVYYYLLEVFGVQNDSLGTTTDKQCQDAILETLRRYQLRNRNDPNFSVQLNIILKTLDKKYSRKMIRDSLGILGDLRYIESYVPPQGKTGRPPGVRYRLVRHDGE